MVLITGLAAVACLSAVAGCASAPTAPQPPVASVAAPRATATSPSAATQSTPASAPASVAAAAEAEATAKMAASLGYVPRKRSGVIVYCRTEPQIGSHFETTTCITAEQVTSAAKRSEGNRDSVEAMQRKSLLQGAGN
jgi:esterase/lipase superfamily enzyme